MDGRFRRDVEFSTGGNESHAALLPRSFLGGRGAAMLESLWLSTFHRYPPLLYCEHPVDLSWRCNHLQSADAIDSGIFTVVFYGLQIFGCKTAQFRATHRESDFPEHVTSATVPEPVKTHTKALL